MSLEWVDSFDGYSTAEIATRYSWNGLGSWSIAEGRNGTSGLSGVTAAANPVVKSLPAGATKIVGFALFVPALPAADRGLVAFYEDSTRHINLRVTSTGTITAYRHTTLLGTSSSAITAGVWQYLEVKCTIHDTAGYVEVRLNGSPILTLPPTPGTLDTRNGGTVGTINGLYLLSDGMVTVTSLTATIDDLVVMNTSGSVNNDFLGDVRVQARFPTDAGNYTQWTPVSGANYTNVDENPPNDDTDYVSSGTPGHIDTYQHEAISPLAATIHAVAVNLRVRKDDGGAREVRAKMRHGSTDANGATTAVPTNYGYQQSIFEDVPGGTGWTYGQVNDAEAGMELVT